jgi:hypothetical protein
MKYKRLRKSPLTPLFQRGGLERRIFKDSAANQFLWFNRKLNYHTSTLTAVNALSSINARRGST